MSTKLLLAITILASVVVASASLANGPHHQCPNCRCVEETVYQNVVTHRCKLVPETKPIKKWVYEVKEVPFCLKHIPLHHDCEHCLECDCPRYKKVLVKKEVVCGEKCGTKCVIEEVVERVPVKICRTIPCAECSKAGYAAVPCHVPAVVVEPTK